MFADAIEVAANFTRPIVLSWRAADGSCKASIGAFVIVNSDGWILTAAHMIRQITALAASQQSAADRLQQEDAIRNNPALNAKQRRRAAKKLVGMDPKKAVRNYSSWWGWDEVRLKEIAVIPKGDLALGRLEPFDSSWVTTYPSFVDTKKSLRIGTSLCRIGFPFHEIKPTYDEQRSAFELPDGSLPIPFFPIEGIFTRRILVEQHANGYPIAFLETSSPGLRGQSGGPIIDRTGTVWGIQSNTRHLDLGFKAKSVNDPHRTEYQFLNVGWASYPETVTGLLNDQGVTHAVADPA